MTHPPRFRTDDPLYLRVREICLGFPEAKEKLSHGTPNFYTRKIFASYSAVPKGDHQSTRWAQSVVFLPDPAEREALLGDSRFFVPGYSGPYGWVGLDLRAAEPDWAEVTELIDASYRNTASAKLIAQLE